MLLLHRLFSGGGGGEGRDYMALRRQGETIFYGEADITTSRLKVFLRVTDRPADERSDGWTDGNTRSCVLARKPFFFVGYVRSIFRASQRQGADLSLSRLPYRFLCNTWKTHIERPNKCLRRLHQE